jgi:hypothetical protein
MVKTHFTMANLLAPLIIMINAMGENQIYGGSFQIKYLEGGGLTAQSFRGLPAGILSKFTQDTSAGKYRFSCIKLRLRGGREGHETRKKKKLNQKDVSTQDLIDNPAAQSGTMLYQPGADGFGEVKVVPEYRDDDILDEIPGGSTPIFEVNLTEIPTEARNEESMHQQLDFARSDW